MLKPDMKANEAFKLLQQEGRNMALVTNDAGVFLGLVTLEDLLEEIVGELP
jgi:CBS domain containing-hemolysin-like protein